MEEIWKPIVIEKNGIKYDYTGKYEVSNLGRVRSLNYSNTGKSKLLKLNKKNNGYLQVVLCKDGKKEQFRVHRLVANTFLPNKDNLQEINHINFDRTDNRVENLEWISHTDNIRYSKSKKVLCIETGIIFNSLIEASKWCGGGNAIGACCRGEQKTCKGYHWKYVDCEQ